MLLFHNIVKYYYFVFSTVNNTTPYEVKVELFSTHNVENVVHAPKAFHVEIRLEKLLKGNCLEFS